MKHQPWLRLPALLVLVIINLTSANKDYENKLTKLWSLSSASSSDGPRTAVLNVTSASILIQPSSYSSDYTPVRTSRESKLPYTYKKFGFKPRAIPLRRSEQSQVERNVYYSEDNVNNRYKPEILFPGDYFPISEKKSKENLTQADNYNNLDVDPFQPKAIPLIREEGFQKRSLDVDEEPIIEKPEGFIEPSPSRRSLSELLGIDDIEEEEDDDDDGDGEYEIEEDVDGKKQKIFKKKGGKGKKKIKKLTKYMMPLLLAYKLKYFALIPLLISGLVLLVGATGLAGFFFALFAAVMGLHKGGY